jgi:hypothetical protein
MAPMYHSITNVHSSISLELWSRCLCIFAWFVFLLLEEVTFHAAWPDISTFTSQELVTWLSNSIENTDYVSGEDNYPRYCAKYMHSCSFLQHNTPLCSTHYTMFQGNIIIQVFLPGLRKTCGQHITENTLFQNYADMNFILWEYNDMTDFIRCSFI